MENDEMTNDAAVAWVVVDQTLRKDSPDPNFMDGAYWTSFETVSSDRALSVVKERQSIRPTGKYEVIALVPATTVAELRARVAECESVLALVLGGMLSGAVKCKPLMTKRDGDYVVGSLQELIENTLCQEKPE